MIGNGLALALPVLLSPLLSRIYEVTDFGQFTIYNAMIWIVTSFASGRYEYAILVTRSRGAAAHLYKLSILLLTAISALSMAALILFKGPLVQFLSIEGIGWVIYLVPFNIFLFALIMINQNSLNREQEYAVISFSKSARSVLSGAVQVLLGLTGWLGGGLMIGKFTGDLFTAGYLTVRLEAMRSYLSAALSFRRLKKLAAEYRRYPQINAFHALLNASSNNSVPILIGLFFSDQILGWFGLSFMVCMAPVQLIGKAVFQVYSRKVSLIFNRGESVYHYTIKTSLVLAKLAALPFLLLTVLGPEMFEIVFGDKWIAAGEYAQILAPYLFLVFILSPLTYLPLVFNEHRKALYFEILSSAFKVISIAVGGWYGNIHLGLLLFSGSGIIIHGITLAWIIGISRRTNS